MVPRADRRADIEGDHYFHPLASAWQSEQSGDIGTTTMANTISMLLDINVPISVQLGQTRMTIRKLLELKKGSLVQLNRMAGEPVDIFIDKKMLAKGEITVVNDNLSVRIGQLYDEKEKFKHL